MKNPNKDFLLQLAALLRAFGDFQAYAFERAPVLAAQVEKLLKGLENKFGSDWDKDLDLEEGKK